MPFPPFGPLQIPYTGKVVHQTAMQCQAQPVRSKVKPGLPKAKEAVRSKQGIKQEESLEIVQTLLGASFGCLSFLRGLLPEESFEEVRYGAPDTPLASYKWFANGGEPENTHPEKVGKDSVSFSGTRMKRLKRGYSSEADHLLNWLEHGIFEALQKSYLKAVQLAIYVDPAQPEVVIEAYTFSFAYRMNPDGTRATPTGFNIKDSHGNEITVADTSRNIQQVMRRMILITQNLPPIPDVRYLTVRLHYMDWTPENYSPPFFRRLLPKEPRLKFRGETEDSVLHKILCGSVATGHHGVSLKVAAFHEPDESQRRSKRSRMQPPHVEEDIEIPSLSGTTLEDSILASSPVESSSSGVEHQQTFKHLGKSPPNQCDIHTVDQSSTKQRSAREVQEASRLREMLVSPKYVCKTNLVETQQDIISSQKYIQLLMAPETNSPLAGGNSKQTLNHKLVSTEPEVATIMEPSHPGSDQTMLKPSSQSLQNHQLVVEIAKLKLSMSKIVELEKIKQMKQRLTEKQVVKEDDVVCECGDKEEDGDMIACEVCSGWLHAHCYGYTDINDIRIPDFVVCYTCLLHNEQNLLDEMKPFVLFRRGLRKVWDEGYPSNNKKLSKLLGCDVQSAQEVTRRLEREGFITMPGSRGKKKPTYAALKYVVVKTDETRRKMDMEYVDPLAKISHHFDAQNSLAPVQDTQLQGPLYPPQSITMDEEETQDEDMPKSATEGEISASKYFSAPDKGKFKLHIPESEDENGMDLDVPASYDSRRVPQTPILNKPIRAQESEPSPWRKNVGVCEEGVYFPTVF